MPVTVGWRESIVYVTNVWSVFLPWIKSWLHQRASNDRTVRFVGLEDLSRPPCNGIPPPHGPNRRKFRSQTSDNMDRWKAEQGRGREKRKIKREKIRRERVRRKKMQMRKKVGKSRNTVFFQWFEAPGGSKSRLAKAAGAEPASQMRDENLRAVVARSRFRSENVQNTPWAEHFWKLRCRKSARRCGAKHISKSKCQKH